jgi:hypothetical protein
MGTTYAFHPFLSDQAVIVDVDSGLIAIGQSAS